MTYPQQERSPTNGLGIAGFIVSLLGVCTGVLFPVGLLISFFALFKRPRGFALAGFIIGLIGTAVIVGIFSLFGLAAWQVVRYGQPMFETFKQVQTAQGEIETWRAANSNALPDDALGTLLISRRKDGWGRDMRYRRLGTGEYVIVSAGSDGVFENGDDLRMPFGGSARSRRSP